MRLIVLTTGSVRRRHFVRALQSIAPVTRVFVETGSQDKPVHAVHPFEKQSKEYERRTWFDGAAPRFEDIADTACFPRLDGPDALEAIAAVQPHVMLVYGTRKLNQSLIDVCPSGAFNIHSGDPERYRGRDAHLWAIYREEFDAVSVAIHRLTAELDGGELLATRPIPIESGMSLFQLRRVSTEVAIELARQAIVAYRSNGYWRTRPQRRAGNYYSSMSGSQKDICVQRFAHHTARL